MAKDYVGVSNLLLMKNNCVHEHKIRYGKSNGRQRFRCKVCSKTWLEAYRYNAYKTNTNRKIAVLTKEGCGIRSIARILKITANTILKRIKQIANTLQQPVISKYKEYAIDELRTYIKQKARLCWVVIGMEKETGKVVSINVGARTNKTLNVVTQTLLNAKPKKIYTDRLKNYKYLMPETLHSVKRFGTNKIERVNLNLRTHLKRLSRRTICYSKSVMMLVACLKIYFWCNT